MGHLQQQKRSPTHLQHHPRPPSLPPPRIRLSSQRHSFPPTASSPPPTSPTMPPTARANTPSTCPPAARPACRPARSEPAPPGRRPCHARCQQQPQRWWRPSGERPTQKDEAAEEASR
eukprot:jgi/Ulvmu1/5205/UM215_0001.1